MPPAKTHLLHQIVPLHSTGTLLLPQGYCLFIKYWPPRAGYSPSNKDSSYKMRSPPIKTHFLSQWHPTPPRTCSFPQGHTCSDEYLQMSSININTCKCTLILISTCKRAPIGTYTNEQSTTWMYANDHPYEHMQMNILPYEYMCKDSHMEYANECSPIGTHANEYPHEYVQMRQLMGTYANEHP